MEKKKTRLESQSLEAQELKQFRDRRGRQIQTIVESVLSGEEVVTYLSHLSHLERVVGEQRQVEDRLLLSQSQIEALERAHS